MSLHHIRYFETAYVNPIGKVAPLGAPEYLRESLIFPI
jgi:hypothetical protein